MSRRARGDLLRALTGAEINEHKACGARNPNADARVRLWELGGVWRVAGPGPCPRADCTDPRCKRPGSTFWLMPADPAALDLHALLTARPARGLPEVLRVHPSGIAVRGTAIRPAWYDTPGGA